MEYVDFDDEEFQDYDVEYDDEEEVEEEES
jgi:hypothetical protein